MANYPIGKLIAEQRHRKGISQENLSEGICSVSSISKIENGLQTPSRKVCEALFQRLGISTRNCRMCISDRDMHQAVLEERMLQSMETGDYDTVESLLREYEDGKESESPLEQQFVFYVRASLMGIAEEDKNEALELLWKAIRISMPNLNMDTIERCQLLMIEEIRIFMKMAEMYYDLGERKFGKRILFYLKEYMDFSEIDEVEKAQIYPKLAYQLACWMENDGRYMEQLGICENGIQLCIRQGRLTEFPMLLASKGYALLKMGQDEAAESCLKQASVIFQAVGDPVRAGMVKDKAPTLFRAPMTQGQQ